MSAVPMQVDGHEDTASAESTEVRGVKRKHTPGRARATKRPKSLRVKKDDFLDPAQTVPAPCCVCGTVERARSRKERYPECGATCIHCDKSYHMGCLDPPRAKVPCVAGWECPECRSEPFSVLDADATVEEHAAQFFEFGMTQTSLSISPDKVQRMFDRVVEEFERNMETVRHLDLHAELEDGFTTFKNRSKDRYDLMIKDFTDPQLFPYLSAEAPWLPMVKGVLGDDAVCIHTGCMLSLPGSVTQPYHSDGDHESATRHLGPHCINVFVPLVDLTMKHGPTEFIPTSHRLGYYDVDVPSLCLTPSAGGVLMFDYRLKHRGRGNVSNEIRPVVYITYATPKFAKKAVAFANFSSKRYHKLPETLDPNRYPSRAERAKRRQQRYDPLLLSQPGDVAGGGDN